LVGVGGCVGVLMGVACVICGWVVIRYLIDGSHPTQNSKTTQSSSTGPSGALVGGLC
jgi:hypothetical protein